MRIVIDMQGAQSTGSRNRGIGRYTLSLSKAIVRNRGEHEVILALNGLFAETIEAIRADFNDLLPQECIRVWYTPRPVNSLGAENNWRRKSAELVREAFIASLNPDIVLVASLFEGLGDDAMTSIGTLSRNIPTATVLYDLIPLIYRQPYLENPVVEAWYENKLDHLRRSDLLLSISESSRQEGVAYLGFQKGTIVNISTASDPQFQPQSISHQQETEIRQRYKLLRPYVMYTGGIDHRKNIEGLIRAYASLPKVLREQHQLAVVCSIQQYDKNRLEDLAKKYQLKKDELVLTGFVAEDDLLALYALCKVFVFPSWHEGFGLPVLEAMSCGSAVIGANTSSVPEVIGREDALFNPRSDEAIAVKLQQVLTDDTFRMELERHGLEQAEKFSWDKSATRTIAAFEQCHTEHQRRISVEQAPARRPKMAYISPLPPERSGISDYSAELLPELSRYYDIDVIVAQDSVLGAWINVNTHIRDAHWFLAHAHHYDRVLYHFGNSHFHQHMFDLLDEVPGVVVLHDFFLSGVVGAMDAHGATPEAWANELYKAHGYSIVQRCFHAGNVADVAHTYPCNLGVLRGAQGVIVHSENSQRLAKSWYATSESERWSVIPHLRAPVHEHDRVKARDTLNLNAEDFVVCSFGMLNPTKLNHRLLEAWLSSKLAKDKSCILVFVGENDAGKYGQDLLGSIQRSGLSARIRITGWADTACFRDYLAAADMGVQLRTLSRGETSGTVLDCMNYGLPTVINANGSMADLDDEAVWKLTNEFSNEQMIEALESLWSDSAYRAQLGECAQKIIINRHAPRSCAKQYFVAIEDFYQNAVTDIHALTDALSKVEPEPDNPEEFLPLAEAVAKSIQPRFCSRQLFVDVSGLVMDGSKDNTQPGMQKLLHELLTTPIDGVRVEPIYVTTGQGYCYARRFILNFLGCSTDILNDEPVEYHSGDIFLGLDFQPQMVAAQQNFYQQMRSHGVKVQFVLYDQPSVLIPQFLTKDEVKKDSLWLEIIAESDSTVCISKAVADEVDAWIIKHRREAPRPSQISWFHPSEDTASMILNNIRS